MKPTHSKSRSVVMSQNMKRGLVGKDQNVNISNFLTTSKN